MQKNIMDEQSENNAPSNSTETGQSTGKGLIGSVKKLSIIGIILTGGAVAALAINSMEATKPESHDEHGGEGGHGGHSDEKADDHSGHAHGSVKMGREVTFDKIKLKNAALGVELAGSATLHPRLSLNGIITPNEEQVVHVTPRFSGVVRKINKRLGSMVKKGDILVTIESDESLNTYSVKSAISGTVIARRVGLGEHVDRDNKLLVVADLSSVWVDFRVYPGDFNKLKLNQTVEISSSASGPTITAKITYISPIGMTDTQSMLARAVVPNPHGHLRPGLFVTGKVLIGDQAAFVAVREEAIQYIDGKPVVFIEETNKKGQTKFIAMDVELGPGDGRFREVYFGVLPGQRYVAANSFILKAELSKGMAAHSH